MVVQRQVQSAASSGQKVQGSTRLISPWPTCSLGALPQRLSTCLAVGAWKEEVWVIIVVMRRIIWNPPLICNIPGLTQTWTGRILLCSMSSYDSAHLTRRESASWTSTATQTQHHPRTSLSSRPWTTSAREQWKDSVSHASSKKMLDNSSCSAGLAPSP